MPMYQSLLVGLSVFFLVLALAPMSRLDKLFAKKLTSWKDLLELAFSVGEGFYDVVLSRLKVFNSQLENMKMLLDKNHYPVRYAKGVIGLQYLICIGSILIAFLLKIPFLFLAGIFVIFIVPHQLKQRWQKARAAMSKHVLSLAELTSVGVSAGLSPLEALNQAVANREGKLFDELRIAINRIRLGVSPQEAFMDVSQRAEIQEMNVFMDQLLQAMETGASGFAESVVDLVRHLRELRQSKIEEIAGKAEAKLLLPLLMFFGALISFLLGPLAFTFTDML